MSEALKTDLMKLARNAFETACTLRESQRIEVYLHDGSPKVSDILEADENLVYGPNRILCYTAAGHNYLEDEIKTWIDYARVVHEPTDDETPMPEPTDVELSIRELADEIAKRKGVPSVEISSYEIFANMPLDLLGNIEQQIIEYWWSAEAQENGKQLAEEQIDEALQG